MLQRLDLSSWGGSPVGEMGSFGLSMWPGAPRAPPQFLAIGNKACRVLGCPCFGNFRDLADPIGFQGLCSTCHLAMNRTTVFLCAMSPWGWARCSGVLWASLPTRSCHQAVYIASSGICHSLAPPFSALAITLRSGYYFLKLLL